MTNGSVPKELKILSIGNSFSVDTMTHLASVALCAGVQRVRLGNLYIGGCSIARHAFNAENDLPAYKYYENDGDGWRETPDCRIEAALADTAWDVVSIQHGTGDGSRYTLPESYEKLPYLVEYVRARVGAGTRIAFNMTWVGEPYHHHPEIAMYGGDQLLIYEKIAALTETLVAGTRGIDLISPTGTAIQNARTTDLKDRLSRDGCHLSGGIGRYIASITFFSRLTGVRLDALSWKPDGVTDEEREIALRAARAAIDSPYRVTAL